MNHIEQLIEDLCPNGVKFVELRDIGVRNKGTSITAARMKILALSPGPIRIFAGGQTIADVAEDAVPKGHVIRLPSIIVKSRGHIGFTFYEKPFTHKSELWSYTIDHPEADQKFVYYFLLTQVRKLQRLARATSVKLPQLSVRDTDTFKVPLPPLEIQREIVRILDKFTALEAELEAELEARQKQYNHYRKQLINEVSIDGEWGKLGEVLENFDRLRRPVTRAARKHGSYPYYGANGIQDYVDQYIFDGTFLLMGEDGSVSQEDGSPVLSWASGKFWVNNHAHVLQARDESFLLRFAYHFLQTVDITRYVTGSAQPKLNQRNMNAIPIVIPRLEVQEYVVSVLDKFDALATDLSSGLPAEITARRKQYEYYRDRLLTFKELAA